MKVYLDACCLNRPFDDQRQLRIRLESEAIVIVLEKFRSGEWQWLSSEALLYELRQNPDVEKRQRTLALAQMAHESVALTEETPGRADVFLTTDDRVVKVAHRKKGLLNLRVDNPARWLEEVLK
jgi:hypothetical protein